MEPLPLDEGTEDQYSDTSDYPDMEECELKSDECLFSINEEPESELKLKKALR